MTDRPCSKCGEEPRSKSSSWGKKCLADRKKLRRHGTSPAAGTKVAESSPTEVNLSPAGDAKAVTPPQAEVRRPAGTNSPMPSVGAVSPPGDADKDETPGVHMRPPAPGTEAPLTTGSPMSPAGGAEAAEATIPVLCPPVGDAEKVPAPSDGLQAPAGGANMMASTALPLRPGRRRLNRADQVSAAPTRDPATSPAMLSTTPEGEVPARRTTFSRQVQIRIDHTECQKRIDELLEEVGRLKGELAKRPAIDSVTPFTMPVKDLRPAEISSSTETVSTLDSLRERIKTAEQKVTTDLDAVGPTERGRGKVTFEKKKAAPSVFPCAGPGRCRVLSCLHEFAVR